MKGREWLKKNGVLLLVAIGGIGILLIGLSSVVKHDETDNSVAPDAYAAAIEQQLSDLLSSMDKVGKCRVMVTMEAGVENLYDEVQREKTTEIQPTVRGVLVLCRGAADMAVRERVVAAVTTALGITSKRVCVDILE